MGNSVSYHRKLEGIIDIINPNTWIIDELVNLAADAAALSEFIKR